jgi:glycosyltransferase involved in cell wall biosynthesis
VSAAPSVSIVIPVYNCRDYVAAAIDSVLCQDHAALEVIVVDDGSTDGTLDMIRPFGDRIVLIQQPNGGQSTALARGWSRASGELLGYLSADDLMRPACVSMNASALAERPGTVLAYPDFGLIDAASQATGVVITPDYSETRLVGELHCLPGPGALFRRDAYDRAGPWNPSLHMLPDLDFFLRLALLGPFVRVPHILADCRIHANATTYRPASPDRADEPMRMVEHYFARPDLPLRIRRMEAKARANALLLCGVVHGRSFRPARAAKCFVHALLSDPASALTTKAAGFIATTATANLRRMLP